MNAPRASSVGNSTLSERLPLTSPVAAAEAERAPSTRWSKAVINFWLDLCLSLVFVGLLVATSVMRFVFPNPTSAAGWSLWSLTYDQWAQLQFVLLAILSAGIVLHVMLHWTWVCGMLTRGRANSSLRVDNGTQTLVGVVVLAVALHLIGLIVLSGLLTVQRP